MSEQEPMEFAFFTDFEGEEVVLTRDDTRIWIDDDYPQMSAIMHTHGDKLHIGLGEAAIDNINTLQAFGFVEFHSSDTGLGRNATRFMRNYYAKWMFPQMVEVLQDIDHE